MNADEIIRSVRATADSHKTITDFPLEAFPKKMIGIISRMVEYNRYSLDFIGSAILSASATAIGNSRKIRIYGDFIVNPALYMLFVARSGMGKTPPTNAASYNSVTLYGRIRVACYRWDVQPQSQRKSAWT